MKQRLPSGAMCRRRCGYCRGPLTYGLRHTSVADDTLRTQTLLSVTGLTLDVWKYGWQQAHTAKYARHDVIAAHQPRKIVRQLHTYADSVRTSQHTALVTASTSAHIGSNTPRCAILAPQPPHRQLHTSAGSRRSLCRVTPQPPSLLTSHRSTAPRRPAVCYSPTTRSVAAAEAGRRGVVAAVERAAWLLRPA